MFRLSNLHFEYIENEANHEGILLENCENTQKIMSSVKRYFDDGHLC